MYARTYNLQHRPPQVDLVHARFIFFGNVPLKMHENFNDADNCQAIFYDPESFYTMKYVTVRLIDYLRVYLYFKLIHYFVNTS